MLLPPLPLRSFPLFFFFFFFFLFLQITPSSSAACNRSCGENSVPYPFGFSPSCRIPLTCASSSAQHTHPRIQVNGFQIRNITSRSLLIDVPPSCNRSLAAAVNNFFSKSYALTSTNDLLLSNCSNSNPNLNLNLSSSGCIDPSSLLAHRFHLHSCSAQGEDQRRGTVICFEGDDDGFLSAGNISASGCSLLLSSFAYLDADDDEGGGYAIVGSSVIVFGSLELGWWLEGECRCSPDASCTRLRSPITGAAAFRCTCAEDFDGDGYADGDGCRKVAHKRCNPSIYMSGRCGETTRVAVLIGGIGVGASLMAVITVIVILIRRHHPPTSRTRKCMKRLLSQALCTVPLYPYKEIEKATNGFSDSQRLGTGAYGTVYAGRLSNDKLVAVKKIRNRDTNSMEQVINEVKLLASVSHPNLVRLLGCCIEQDEQILVYEFMPNGTLSQHLQRERGSPPLPWTARLSIAAETAKAIAYLHSAIDPPIYHRDIKSSNILLDYSYSSKVADFGLSRTGRMADQLSHISTTPQGTPGYLDPQYHQNFHLSDKSDVYSFGVVLVEIITAQKVVDFSRAQSEVNLAALAVERIGKGRVDEIVDPWLEPNRDAWTLFSIHKVAELAFRCLAFHREVRPSMTEVAEELEQLQCSSWAQPEEDDNIFMSPASSLCSFRSNCTERSQGASKGRRMVMAVDSLREEEEKGMSPVCVQDPWFSEQSSPSTGTNSLLGHNGVQ